MRTENASSGIMPAIQLHNVVQGYKRTMVLQGINLDLRPGITALVGPNGAGKSTLLKTMATIMKPRSGSVDVAGTPLTSRASVREARSKIGYLPQDFGADPSFSVRDFVTYVGWLRQIPRPRLYDAVSTAVANVELTEHARTPFKALSGGMRQRAGIAAATVGEPQIIILDEPTVGLDPEQRLEFRTLLRGLAATAVLLSTHLIEDVAAVAERVILLNEGRFIFDGSVASLREHAGPEMETSSALESAYVQMLKRT